MNAFKRFYFWAMNAKLTMGVFYVAIVFVIGVLSASYGIASIGLLTLLEVLIVSMVIGFSQALLLPDTTDYSRGILFLRSAIWIALSVALTTVCSALLNWFAGLPNWCPWVLAGFMLFGCPAMLLGKQFEQNADTIRLNEGLRAYKA